MASVLCTDHWGQVTLDEMRKINSIEDPEEYEAALMNQVVLMTLEGRQSEAD